MPALEKQSWSPVRIDKAYTVVGGFLKKPQSIETFEIDTPEGPQAFTKNTKQDTWLIKATAGVHAQRGILKRSKVFDIIKEKLIRADAGTSDRAAVAASAVASDGDSTAAQTNPKLE